MKWTQLLWVLMGVAGQVACGSAGEGEGSEPEVRQVVEPLQGPICGSNLTHQCWGPVSQGQASAFDDWGDFKWFVRALTPTQVWPVGQFWTAGYLDTNVGVTGGLPSPAKSVAVDTTTGFGRVFALSEDNVVRYSTGTPASSHKGADGTNFAHWNLYIQPLDKQGASLCFQKIVSLGLPTNFGQGRLLMGLTCAGNLYVQDLVGAERRWMPAGQHPGFVGLPSTTWTDISHHRDGGAALLRKNGSDVYRAAMGSIINGAGAVSWKPVQVLARIFKNGTRLIPVKVGGRNVITTAGNGSCVIGVGCDGDEDRFYRYDASTASWNRHTGGTWWVPHEQSDLLPATSYYKAIVDDSNGFSVLHAFSWMIPWVD